MRFFLHPLDCVKTTVQAEMGTQVKDLEGEAGNGGDGGSGWVASLTGILRKGGVGELLRGIDVSTVSSAWAIVPLFSYLKSLRTGERREVRISSPRSRNLWILY